jgi:hypothetical protein
MQETKFIEYDSNAIKKDENHKSISTQVDHIALIIAQDPIHAELFKNKDLVDIENQRLSKIDKKKKRDDQKQEIEDHLKQLNNDGSQTVHVMSSGKSKKGRRRLDSAPSCDSDANYNDDVNYTLSGYLHTIHSFRQYMQTQRQTPHLTTILSGKDKNDQNNDGTQKVPLLSKMFSQPNNDNVDQVNELNDKKNEVEKPLIEENDGVKVC